MSSLIALIKKSKAVKKELVSSTIRMTIEENSFIEDLAEYLSLSKQETMLNLLQAGVEIAEKELNLNSLEEELENNNFFILNTNKRHSVIDHDNILKNGVSAAFYAPSKYSIDRIKKGDTVFLYENGVGIIAYGKGTGNTLTKDHNGNKDECHYQVLEDFVRLDKPLSAKDIKKILGRNVVFLRTMSGITDGQQILDEIIKG